MVSKFDSNSISEGWASLDSMSNFIPMKSKLKSLVTHFELIIFVGVSSRLMNYLSSSSVTDVN